MKRSLSWLLPFGFAFGALGTFGACSGDEFEPEPAVPDISIFFDSGSIAVPAGREVVVAPYYSHTTASTTYEWKVDDAVVEGQAGETFRFGPIFRSGQTETHTVTITAVDGDGDRKVSQSITVRPAPREGTYRRQAAGDSSARSTKVFEFLPAPGQFINEGYDVHAQAEANAWAEETLAAGGMVSLGAFGGYIVVGFDHSVVNSADGFDLAVEGNAFVNSSEPGIVWVMQDDNGDGLPNDMWYELRGSGTGKAETRQRYSLTYFRPSGPGRDVRWVDCHGITGAVEANGFHDQSYYPAWIEGTSYTLRGTNLASRTFDQSGDGGYWVNRPFEWGYVDNYGSDYEGGEALLDIDNAIHADGTPVDLRYVDFVKVQVGLNVTAGWSGENSTEVFGFRDLGL